MLCLNLNKDTHCTSMFDKLEGMRREKKHCDFIIKVGSDVIDTHRNILAAGSDYFDAMLSHDTKENRSGVVEMIDADAECVKICIGYIYGGKVEVSMEKCEQLMYIANLMQLQKICDGVTDLIGEQLDVKSYFATKRIAVMFHCKHLDEQCQKFAEENFLSLSREEDFGNLDKSYVKKMMKSKNVKMTEEEKVDVSLKWVRQDEERNAFFGEMLECVDLDRVPAEYRRHLLENETLVMNNLEYFKILSISVMNTMKLGTRQFDSLGADEERERGKETGIVVFDKISGCLQFYNPRANTWKEMQKMHGKMLKRGCFSSVALDDHIYILMESKSVLRLKYLDETATWEQMADMIEGHGSCPPATVVAREIYVIGGHSSCLTKSAEKYDAVTDQWTKLKDKPQASKCSAILSFRESIYSFGGYMCTKRTNIVHRFDPSSSSWTDVRPMKEYNAYVAVVELNGKVYVLGGYNGYDRSHLKSFNRYDPDVNEWVPLSPMKMSRSWFRAFVVNGFIYAVGGYNSSPDSIEKYDVEKDEWEIVLLPSEKKIKILESVNAAFK